MKKKIGLLAMASLLLMTLSGCSQDKSFFDNVSEINDIINDFVWMKIGLYLLLGTGIIMTLVNKFLHSFKHYVQLLRQLLE